MMPAVRERGQGRDLEDRILEAIGDAVLVLDGEGAIVAANPAAERLTKRAAAELAGLPFAELLPDGSPEALEFPGLGGAERVDLALRVGPARVRSAVSLTPLAGGSGLVALVKPMGPRLDPAGQGGTARRAWHRTLGAIVRELVGVAGRDLAAVDDSEALARVLVGQAIRLLPDVQVLLSIVPRERQDHFRIVAGAGPWAESLVGREWPQGITIAGRSLIERRPLETTRLDELTGLRSTVESGGIRSARLVPLLARRTLPDGRTAFGTLGFYRTGKAYFSPYERRLIGEFGRLVSVALQRTELRHSADEAAVRLATGMKVAVDLAHSLELRGVIRRLLQRALEVVDADRVTIMRVDGEAMTVEDSLDSAGSAAPIGQSFALADLEGDGLPLAQLAAREQQPRISRGYSVRGMARPHAAGLDGVLHTLTLPLVLSGSTTALLLVSRRRDRAFARDDELALRLLGNLAVQAIGNARLYAEARAASAARSDFLNMAAHELRTPLTVVGGYLSMLRDGTFGPMPESWAEVMKLLTGKAAELDRLVDDLLLASQLESGGPAAHDERVDLKLAAELAATRAKAQLRLVGGEMVLDLPDRPLPVRADAEHLARVLDNLVNNAIAYRRPGEPAWVRLDAGRADGVVYVGVEDRGRGVAAEMRERIFERFVRVEEPASAKTAGTGLGLYICRQLAARHGGQVQLERSAPGEGSRFTLRLPAAGGRAGR